MGDTTRSILDGIQCGTALEAVNAVRFTTAPPGPTFLPQLDDHILPHRPMSNSSLQRGDFVEVVGPSGSGKTSLLVFFLFTHLLPHSIDLPLAHGAHVRIQLGGKNASAALIYNTSQRSLISDIARSMRGHIRDCLSSLISAQSGGQGQGSGRYARVTEDAMEGVVRSSLARLRVVKVKSRYKSWALALRSLALPMRAPREGQEEEGDTAPSLVCLDGLSKCHWTEKWADEERSLASTSTGPRTAGVPPGITPTDGVGMRDVMQAIGRLRLDLGCAIMCTTQGLWHEKKAGTALPTPFYTPYLPSPFPAPWAVPRSAGGPGPNVVPDSGSGHAPAFGSSLTQHPSASSQYDTNDADEHLASKLRARDPAYWPMTFQLTLTGRERGLQMPSDTMLADALLRKEAERAQGKGSGADRFGAKVRMHGVEGPLGNRGGVGWAFGMGSEGLESFVG